MRPSAVWFLIAVLWLVIAIVAALHSGWQRAWLQAVVALLFFAVAVYFRRKERIK
jgi:phosphoglycerol transferase MdoB-like AlkP superfamily enzyme